MKANVLVPVCDLAPGHARVAVRATTGHRVELVGCRTTLAGPALCARGRLLRRGDGESLVEFADGQVVWVKVLEPEAVGG